MQVATHSCVKTAFFDRPTKRFTFRCCLNPLKEQLDLPPGLVQVGDRLGDPRGVVGHEHVAICCQRVAVDDPSQPVGIDLAAAGAGQFDRLVAENTGPGSDVMLVGDPVPHAALEACHEGDATGLQLVKPREIEIGAVGDDHAAGLERPRAGHGHVAGLAIGDADETRQVAGLVQPDVQLDRGLRAAERRPRENRQTQVDGRRIDRIQLVPEAETVARRPLLATTQQTAEQRFVERVGLLGVDPRERRAADRPNAQVIELGGLRAQIAHDVAQALPAGQLAQPEGDELRPAAHDAQTLPALMAARLGVEFMSRKQRQKLPEDCVTMGHGLDLLCFE